MTTRMEKPEKNKTGKPREVPDDVRKKQNPEYSEADFDAALDRVTRKLGGSSRRDRGSSKK